MIMWLAREMAVSQSGKISSSVCIKDDILNSVFFLILMEYNTDIYMHMIKNNGWFTLMGYAAEKLRTNADDDATCITTTSVLCRLAEVKFERYPTCQCFLIKWLGKEISL